MSVANEPDAAVPQPRSGPLVVRVGEDELILLADDVDTIVAGADKLAAATRQSSKRASSSHARQVAEQVIDDLEALAVLLESSGTRLNDPPVELNRDRARLMRQILADIEGYQRRELSPVLRDLRQLVAAES
jgi:hypothetical protein